MFSKTLFRTCLRSIPPKPIRFARPSFSQRLSPRTPLIRPQSRLFSETATRPRNTGPRYARQKPWTQPNYQEEVRKARPLITTQQLKRVASHPRTRWSLVFVTGGGVIFYVSNLETVPVSGRQIFNCYSEESVEAEAQTMYKMIMQQTQSARLPSWDNRSRMVQRVMKRLIEAGNLQHVDWEVHVIQSDEANAFVIPGGKVFVYTGILPIAKNDDGLAAILGHEIAHNLAKHQAERLSQLVLLEPLRWVLIYLDATFFGIGVGQVLGSIAMDLGLMRPASRKQESEADYIGLLMMARSCYNPQEAVHVWERMEAFHKQHEQIPEFMSTHPSNKSRISQMQNWLLEAEEARSESDCAATILQAGAFQPAMKRMVNYFQ